MSLLLEKMKKDVKALRESYKNLSWWKQLFYPRGLGSVLLEFNNEEPYTLLHVYQTFFSNAWFFQRWTYSSLRLFSSSLATSTLKLAYRKIEGLDDVDNLDEMDNERWNMLNVAYYSDLLESELTPTIMQLRVTRDDSSIASAFQKLQEQGLLKGEFAESCLNAMVNPRKNLKLFQDHYDFAWSLVTLQEMNLLQGTKAQTNFNAVMNHRQPSSFHQALCRLELYKLLTATHGQANFDAIINHKHPKKVTIALDILNKIGLLMHPDAQDNFEALISNNTDPLHIAQTLKILHKVGLLTGAQAQTNIHNIVKYQDLLTDNYLLSKIPAKKMTQEYLDELITICQQPERSADERRGQIVLSWLKNSPEAFPYIESRDDRYTCQYVSPFIVSTLKELHQREETRPLNTIFDLADDEESRLCFYIIRNLIRNNSSEALNEIRFLLSIPAVRALAVTEGASGKNTNELLKLAVTLDNTQAAAILLEIPEVNKLAEQHNYYLKEDSSESKSYATSSKLGLFGQNRAEKSDANDDVDETTSSLTQDSNDLNHDSLLSSM